MKIANILKKVLSCIVFLCLLAGILSYVNVVLTAKQTARQLTPMAVYHDFYSMEENTVDVIFLGSSHTYSGFSPQYLYDSFGIRSYNLGSSQQDLTLSYYWLKEALQTQSPKAVVLDTCTFFQWFNDNNTNAQEGFVRKAMDFMRWGPNKLEAVWTLSRLEPEELSLESFFLPNIRYHNRWKELTREDVEYKETFVTGQSKGYSGMYVEKGGRTLDPIVPGESEDTQDFYGPQVPYIHKLIDLCREEGIALILVRTPYDFSTAGQYNALTAFAREEQLPFYDFNEKSLYEATGFDFGQDIDDNNHCNVWGAQKLTAFVGKILQEEYGIPSVRDDQYEATRTYYQESLEDAELRHIDALSDFLPRLERDRFVILAAAGKKEIEEAAPEILQVLDQYGYDLSDGFEVRLEGGDQGDLTGRFWEERISYQISPEAWEASILLDGEEKRALEDGVNFVVYDLHHQSVVERAAFSLTDGSALERIRLY